MLQLNDRVIFNTNMVREFTEETSTGGLEVLQWRRLILDNINTIGQVKGLNDVSLQMAEVYFGEVLISVPVPIKYLIKIQASENTTAHELRMAIDSGKKVFWASLYYECIKGKGDYLIRCTANGYCIGLTWADNKTLNGKPKDFFIL